MDPTHDVSDTIPEDLSAALAAKQRFESFKLGKGLPSSHTTPNIANISHSPNTSISSSVSAPSFSTSNTPPNDVTTLPKRPNSHHRRRSSVSTRRESADMMGVAEPDLPPSSSDDNINFGDKDSIRRRALWALEGKPDLSYSKVEIPELTSPESENKPFNFPSRSSHPPGGSGTAFGPGLNSLLVKRDSFKLLPSSSSKDQLHTLVEEEEEEDETSDSDAVPITPDAPESLEPAPRPRPAKLSLRPLSLTPDKFQGLPTPPTTGSSLKSLSLVSTTLKSTNGSDDLATNNVMNRQSLVHSPSPTPPPGALSRRSPLAILCDTLPSAPLEEAKPKRRSSISYKNSHSSLNQSIAGLPTPEMTPTSEHRFSGYSFSSTDDDFPHSRSLSASEQHFLFKSHNALLARITDLERALSSRSRPLSCASDVSSEAASEPSDEMLRLLADLKAERDDLKRDVDGWRTRVGDLEKQISIYSRRVEAERRDAWVARSRVGLFEIEKSALEKALDEKTLVAQDALRRCDELKDECEGLRTSLQKMQVQVKKSEVERLRSSLAYEEETKRRVELEKELDRVDLLATPTAPAFEASRTAPIAQAARNRDSTVTLADSESSATDVESVDGLRLKAVLEEDYQDYDDEENELLRYEDGEDSDVSFESPSGSSCDSLDNFILRPRSRPIVSPSDYPHASADPTHPMVPWPGHNSRSSLSQTWTFPKHLKTSPITGREEVDHFFGCLEDADASPPLNAIAPTYEASKSLFSQGLSFESDVEADDMPPFLLPRDVGVVVESSQSLLDIVLEEVDEDAEVTEEEITEDTEVGGIKIVFTPPQPDNSPLDVPTSDSSAPFPTYEPSDEDEEPAVLPFTFGRTNLRQAEPYQAKIPPHGARAQKPHASRKVPPPSSIPRVAHLKSQVVSSNPNGNGTPPKAPLGYFIPPGANTCVTPPSKRGGAMPSFIPQPVSVMPPPKRVNPAATFIPQPQRKSGSVVSGDKRSSSASNGSTFQPHLVLTNETINTPRRSKCAPQATHPETSHARLTSTDTNIPVHEYPQGHVSFTSTSSFSSIMSSPFATRLSTFTPFSWAASQVKPVAAAALCLISEGSSSGSATDERIGSSTSAREIFGDSFERRERKYVSKEQQLEKLRNRLRMTEGAPDMCKKCQDGVVSL